jgi:hypothetical protein
LRLVPQLRSIYLDRTGNVLNLLRSEFLEPEAEYSQYLVTHRLTYTDLSGLSQRLNARRDVDTVAEDVFTIDDDVAEVNADPKLDSLICRHRDVAVGHAALHVDGTPHGVDHAGELEEQAVTHRLDDAAPMFCDLGVD